MPVFGVLRAIWSLALPWSLADRGVGKPGFLAFPQPVSEATAPAGIGTASPGFRWFHQYLARVY